MIKQLLTIEVLGMNGIGQYWYSQVGYHTMSNTSIVLVAAFGYEMRCRCNFEYE